MSSKALVHVKTVRKPISDEVIGFRLEAAIPNQEGRVMRAKKNGGETVGFYATQQPTPSFRKPYFIAQSSDYTDIDPKKIERFLDELRWHGYREFELVGRFAGEPLADMMR